MVDPTIVDTRIEQLQSCLIKLQELARLSYEEFAADFRNTESAKHLLQVSVECCLDLAHHIIADAGFRTPKDNYDSFVVISEEAIIPESFLPTLRQMVRFRNRVVHLYWDVENLAIHQILQDNLEDFETYVTYILDYTRSTDEADSI